MILVNVEVPYLHSEADSILQCLWFSWETSKS